ncbi:MAG: hypothetical protein RSF67_07050 [Clostridia bacterium]
MNNDGTTKVNDLKTKYHIDINEKINYVLSLGFEKCSKEYFKNYEDNMVFNSNLKNFDRLIEIIF